ncbi:MAG: SDR family oxidoreductase, partial [Candidatus Heimdallarchaeota archaeon]|nr:SDR family oxidoreductase [Candidatus Heimdallarchaeota archaeon]
MINNNSGTIINISSFAGVRSSPMASAYGVSKAAIARFTDNLSESLKDYDIGVFAISPGLVLTDMTKDHPFFKTLPPEAWTPIEKTSELVNKLVTGKYNKLSGRFIHVIYDIDNMLTNVNRITEEGLYILRLPTLEGLEE